ncbi:MAG: AAA family ATPase [Verrucomicrobiales bacterium]|nr:AAA family ATPase [Verrucomicrobiales bacterium]
MADTSDPDPALVHDVYGRLKEEIAKVIAGQEHVINTLLLSLFCQGHCLLIGVPGLAKTLLVKSLAESLGMDFSRIQFTPDLMPGDILGAEILRDQSGSLEFEFQLGPIFTNLLLADEINRTPPKTQSALLEAMQERKVTVARETRDLPDPFLVVATQNPIEHEGTYPLPEAQLDRFMFSINVGYPGKDIEAEIVRRTTRDPVKPLTAVVTQQEILDVEKIVRAVPVADHVIDYAVELSNATRATEEGASETAKNYIEWGAGPRASQYLVLGAKALALMSGKSAPETSHVRTVAPFVFSHRIVPNYRATGEGLKPAQLVTKLVEEVKEPADY